MSYNRIPLICIVGPTASGKTSLSVEIAKLFNGEIVSADSMQIYKGMNIATAMPTEDEKQGISHHMMGFVDINEKFSVAQYCELAHDVIKDIYKRGKQPILVGGTGLYVDSLINNITFSDCEGDDDLRISLQKEYEKFGVDYLLDKLVLFDEESARKLSQTRNVKRIIRAIEVYELTGKTISQYNAESKQKKSPYFTAKIGLTATDRQYLYDRINLRVDKMLEAGLLKEAEEIYTKSLSSTACMAIGHKELIPYFEKKDDLENCVEVLKMQTRRYAKRQLTWFKRDDEINWINIDLLNNKELLEESVNVIKKVLFNEKDTNSCCKEK